MVVTQRKETTSPLIYFIKNSWKVLKRATISQSWEGCFASDHFAVLATLVL
jgi:hypothetical protein